MTAKRQSPIKLKDILAESKKVDVMSTFVVDPETKKTVKYNEYFDRTQVEKLTLELFNDMQYAIEKEYSFFESEEQLIKYELLLIIKYFSHFKNEIGDTFEEKIMAMEALMKIGLFDLFFDEIFDQNQVGEVIERVNKVAEKAVLAQEAINEALETKGDFK
ncbi:hypothetical protein B1B04_09255 [Lysinibacillus sp. KCTC 33748]|uniref:hypothetical protein n=1 Tax=unclassified Lysinibacillus TaxID=2636778 RepID=UPI0009A8585D|nr:MULTISPECIES: hypothetical protein [unclassified Lysinibacillus]OXS74303.1 hypothetical protein B1B04_09255 [Lysinibacillus sp. KCTC 33748]SKB63966.1 hypothetical protein SAMN06295926_10533 [Lysinibacillus sp. AC-3]